MVHANSSNLKNQTFHLCRDHQDQHAQQLPSLKWNAVCKVESTNGNKEKNNYYG